MYFRETGVVIIRMPGEAVGGGKEWTWGFDKSGPALYIIKDKVRRPGQFFVAAELVVLPTVPLLGGVVRGRRSCPTDR